jgi:geranylgeranyl diphosphate synthase, type I
MVLDASSSVAALLGLTDRFDAVLRAFLAERRADLASIDPAATEPVDEVVRLLEAGGKRVRPAFCYWGFRAAGGPDGEPIVRASAALELLHTMALIHDDVMDASPARRGTATVHVRQSEAAARRGSADAARVGASVAIVAGDLSAVLADQLLLESGFPPDRLAAALARYHRIRVEMAAGQYLDLVGASVEPRRLAHLKGGAYTVLGPLLIGAALAGASGAVEERLRAYGEPLGQAFQLLDDLRDGDAARGVEPADVTALIAQAKTTLRSGGIDPIAMGALGTLADMIGDG